MEMKETTDRVAWTQYEWQGRGCGLNAYKHKQPEGFRKELSLDYYIRTNGKA